MYRLFAILLALVVGTASGSSKANVQKLPDSWESTEELILNFTGRMTEHDVTAFAADNGLRVVIKSSFINSYKFAIDRTKNPLLSAAAMARRLRETFPSIITLAEAEAFCVASGSPSDPEYVSGSQYWVNRVLLPAAWDMNTGSADVIIGVLDSGVDRNHGDLQSAPAAVLLDSTVDRLRWRPWDARTFGARGSSPSCLLSRIHWIRRGNHEIQARIPAVCPRFLRSIASGMPGPRRWIPDPDRCAPRSFERQHAASRAGNV